MQPSGISAPGTTNFRLLVEWSLLLSAAVALVLTAHWRGWTDRIDARLLDFATETLLAEEASGEILIVAVDDRSLSGEDAWPWDRARHARLVEQAQRLGAKAIVFDILFLEPLSEEGDAALANAIERAGKVALPHTFAALDGAQSGRVPAYPLPALSEAAAIVGHVAVVPDSDGAVRRFSLIEDSVEGKHRHLAYAVASAVAEIAEPSSPTVIVPLQPSGKYRTVSASELYDGALAPDAVRGKIILIGATAQGLGDRYAVPDHAGRIMTGVELQANLFDALLNDNLVTEAPQLMVIGVMIGSVVLLLFAFWYFSPRRVLILSIALIALLLLTLILSVSIFRLWLPIGPALLAIIVAYPLWGWRRLASVSRYLDREARALQAEVGGAAVSDEEGFDTIARQVGRLSRLSGKVRSDFAFMRSVINASPDPMLVLDGDGTLEMLNQPASVLFGHTETDVKPTFAELKADAGAFTGDDDGELELTDGRVFLLAKAELDSESGSEILALRDVTALKQAERQRQDMLEFLSHDMRSPQVAIIGLAGRAGENTAKAERLSRIQSEARRTLKLAEDFVQIARLEQAGLQMEDTDLGALLFEASDRAYPHAKRRQISVESDVPEEPVFCEVDAFALSRAIDNLLGNSIKFAPEGSVVRLALELPDPGKVRIVVDDEGPGLPPERRDSPFARFGAHDKSAGPSSGLGLAYVDSVVREHGGTVQIEEKSAPGTRIVIELPYDSADGEFGETA